MVFIHIQAVSALHAYWIDTMFYRIKTIVLVASLITTLVNLDSVQVAELTARIDILRGPGTPEYPSRCTLYPLLLPSATSTVLRMAGDFPTAVFCVLRQIFHLSFTVHCPVTRH